MAGTAVAATTAGAATPLCNLGVFTAVTALSKAMLAFVLSYLEEVTEPFLLVNYPLNFMSTSDSEYLLWANSGADCTDVDYCGDGDYFMSRSH